MSWKANEIMKKRSFLTIYILSLKKRSIFSRIFSSYFLSPLRGSRRPHKPYKNLISCSLTRIHIIYTHSTLLLCELEVYPIYKWLHDENLWNLPEEPSSSYTKLRIFFTRYLFYTIVKFSKNMLWKFISHGKI